MPKKRVPHKNKKGEQLSAKDSPRNTKDENSKGPSTDPQGTPGDEEKAWPMMDGATGSVDSRTKSSLQRIEDARRTVESITQRGAPPYQASNSSTSGSSQGQPKFYDIYLKFSKDTDDVQKVKTIIHRNDWTMMTPADSRLGVPKMTSIEDALKTCSHVVLIITKEDCEKDDTYWTMTMGMAFQSTVGRSLNGRVISIRCCEESHLPLSLQSLENACIDDPFLEDKLKKTIDVSIRKKKEGSSVAITPMRLDEEDVQRDSMAPLQSSSPLVDQPSGDVEVQESWLENLPELTELTLWKVSEVISPDRFMPLGLKLGLPQIKLKILLGERSTISQQEEKTFMMLYQWYNDQVGDQSKFLFQVLTTDEGLDQKQVFNLFFEKQHTCTSFFGRSFQDLQLWEIAEELHVAKLIPLSLRLGLTYERICSIREDSNSNPVDVRYNVMVKWQKEQTAQIDQVETLAGILEACHERRIAYKIRQNHLGVTNEGKTLLISEDQPMEGVTGQNHLGVTNEGKTLLISEDQPMEGVTGEASKEMKEWTEEEVAIWLKSNVRLPDELVSKFVGVDGFTLVRYTKHELIEDFELSAGYCKRLMLRREHYLEKERMVMVTKKQNTTAPSLREVPLSSLKMEQDTVESTVDVETGYGSSYTSATPNPSEVDLPLPPFGHPERRESLYQGSGIGDGNNEGNDGQLTSLKVDSGSNQEDVSFGGLSAPPEILARGQRAQQAYAEAAQAGTKKVFRTRLMLVGQERVGKTSLKKTLTGLGFDQNEAVTDGVETRNTCEICIEVAKAGEKMWSIHKKGHGNEDTKGDEYRKALADVIAKRLIVTPPQDQESLESHSDTTHSRGLNPEETGDEYRKALADVIAKIKRLIVTPPQDQASLESHSDTTFARGRNPVEAEEFVLDNVEAPKAKKEDVNMPNQIASLVEKMLKEQVHLKEKGTDSTERGRGEGVSLSIWDFAGHDIYYTTHQVFLTWRAIYVIVFDLSRSLDSVIPLESRDEYYEMAKGGAKSELTCLEFINFWLCSIYAHAVAPSSVRSKNTSKTAQQSPPIFIVGTHRESVEGDAKEKKKKIGSAFKRISEHIMKKPFECHVVPKYYAIENSLEDKDEELVALRRHIEKVAMEEPYMGEEIPLRWLLFEEALAADKINYMSLDQTKELTQPVGMKSEHELLTMLTFYHDLGYVVYYGGIEDQQSLLRDMVILNPQWLIDVFKQVISILDPAKRDGIVSDAWTILQKDGILEDRLIQYMWRGFSEHKEALVQLMAKFDLICDAPVERLQQEQQDGVDTEVSNETEKVVKKRYYVPSRLTSDFPPEEFAQIKTSTDFYVDFIGFLPDGLFHRLMASAVRWMGERDGEPVNLFHRHISLMVDGVHHALIEMLPPREAIIKVTVFRGAVADSDHDGDSHKPPAPSAVKKVMDFVTETLDSLRQHWARRIEYDVCFLCPKCSKKKLLKDCYKGMPLKCGIHNIHTAAIKFKFGMSVEGVEPGNESPITSMESIVLCAIYFSNLAEQIGSEWHRLGIRLGLNQADIDHITEDNLTAVNRILATLQLWKCRSTCTDKRKVEKLCMALSSCSRTDLADKVKKDAGIC